MTNKESITRDISLAFDFVRYVVKNPNELTKIPDNAEVIFLDDESLKSHPVTAVHRKNAKFYVERIFQAA